MRKNCFRVVFLLQLAFDQRLLLAAFANSLVDAFTDSTLAKRLDEPLARRTLGTAYDVPDWPKELGTATRQEREPRLNPKDTYLVMAAGFHFGVFFPQRFIYGNVLLQPRVRLLLGFVDDVTSQVAHAH
jgi:hypothetical protein